MKRQRRNRAVIVAGRSSRPSIPIGKGSRVTSKDCCSVPARGRFQVTLKTRMTTLSPLCHTSFAARATNPNLRFLWFGHIVRVRVRTFRALHLVLSCHDHLDPILEYDTVDAWEGPRRRRAYFVLTSSSSGHLLEIHDEFGW
jgi:hypothetical protein